MGNYIYANGERKNEVLGHIKAENYIGQLGASFPIDIGSGYLVELSGFFSNNLGDTTEYELRFYDENSGRECCPAKVKIVFCWPARRTDENSLVILEEIRKQKTKDSEK